MAGKVEEASEAPSLVTKCESFVREALAGNDASHDFAHIHRVRNMALLFAKEEGLTGETLEVVELGALLHDIGDWKYTGSDTAGSDMAKDFLAREHASEDVVRRVVYIIDNISFSTEIAQRRAGIVKETPPELAVVQDADRIDAVGAIGIGRCFTFGGAKKRVMHDPAIAPLDASTMTKEQYRNNNSTTINHFYEKLLTIKDMMKTKAGKRAAAQRQDFMLSFLEQFHREWHGVGATKMPELHPRMAAFHAK